MRRGSRLSNQWNVWLKKPKINGRGKPDFAQTKLCSSSTIVNLKSKRRNAPIAVKPSIMLITWRSTWEVVRRQLYTLANSNYVKPLRADHLQWKMDSQHLRNWWLKKVEVGDALADRAEHWKPSEIEESALKYMALTLRKAFNSSNKRDIIQRLKEVIHIMRPTIEGQTGVNAEALKWYLSLKINFCKSTSPGSKTDPAVTFRSEVFKLIITHEFNY